MMHLRLQICLGLALAAIFTADARAADADTDWKEIVALDAGPKEHPHEVDAARASVLEHLTRQEKALRGFTVSHPEDAHVFEARLRLARLFQIRGDMENSEKLRSQSRQMLADLEKTASPTERTELEFSKIAQRMRALRQPTQADSDGLLAAARKFQTNHPDDRRIASLLAEVATLFDNEPKAKEAILVDAQRLATEPDLQSRIADDLKRVHLFKEVVPLHFTSVQGHEVDLADFRGKPAVVIFFASFSYPSINALATVERSLAELPKGAVHVIGVSLDKTNEKLAGLLKANNVEWPVACDGRGWEGDLVRSLGINALPTVWIVDQTGRLRSLNGLDNFSAKLRQLLTEKPEHP